MSQVTNLNNLNNATASQPFGDNNTLNNLDLTSFLDLMIAELQNQDPLNPLENDKLIAQIGQMRQIGATDKLSETLGAALLGQNIASATNLIGAEIKALSDDNQQVTGVVESVSIEDGSPKLHFDNQTKIRPSDEPGEITAGTYKYRVEWIDTNGNQFAIDPVATDGIEDGALQLSGDDNAVLISGLPATAVAKRVYRTDGTGAGNFRLVATIPDGSASSYVDTTSDSDLSEAFLQGNPQLFPNTTRSFTVSLKNVSEIKSPGN